VRIRSSAIQYRVAVSLGLLRRFHFQGNDKLGAKEWKPIRISDPCNRITSYFINVRFRDTTWIFPVSSSPLWFFLLLFRKIILWLY